MTGPRILVRAACAAMALVLPATVLAAGGAERAQRWEATLQGRYVNSDTIEFENGASADLSSSTGFGFGFAYNFDSRLAAGLDLVWNNVNYAGTITNGSGASQSVSGTALTGAMIVSGTYHLLEGPITPYVNGGLGFTHTDTGIPQGTTTGCWWYPWFGLVCGPITFTKTSTDWTYLVGAGIRWDVTRGFFLKAGVQQQWVGVGSASGIPSFTGWRFDIGFKF